ncbi:MAG: ATP-binding protein [Candidatus Ozemobacteraceae bacterium]
MRVNTESIAKKMGFCDDDVFDITLAVEEAYTNAVEHSGRPLVDVELEITYLLYDDRIEVSVQDSGQGFEQRKAVNRMERVFVDPLVSDRGRGLGLIKHLTDKFEILSQPGLGTLIRIVKFLEKGSLPDLGSEGDSAAIAIAEVGADSDSDSDPVSESDPISEPDPDADSSTETDTDSGISSGAESGSDSIY